MSLFFKKRDKGDSSDKKDSERSTPPESTTQTTS